MIFLGLLDFSFRFFVTGVLLFIGGVVLLKYSPYQNKITTWLLVFGFWFFSIGSMFIYSFFESGSGFLGTPFFIITLLSVSLATFLYKKDPIKILKTAMVYIALVGVLTYYFVPNYFAYYYDKKYKNIANNKPLPPILLYNENGTPFDLKKEKGKILVIDFWNSACGNCIRAFPKFDALKKEFEKDPTIRFYSVNIPLARDVANKSQVKKFVDKFSFQTLYADKNISGILHIKAVPVYIIIDKNQNIKYIGDLNTDGAVFYNNFYDILNKIK
jgi:thiol-disulfide isomerase/thioredoxin